MKSENECFVGNGISGHQEKSWASDLTTLRPYGAIHPRTRSVPSVHLLYSLGSPEHLDNGLHKAPGILQV